MCAHCRASGYLPSVAISLTIAAAHRDTVFLALPLIVTHGSLNRDAKWPSLPIGTAALAAAGLAKFSIIILATPLLLLADFHRMVHRRAPFLLSLFFFLLFLMFWQQEGEYRSFFDFLYYSIEVTTGYTAAMQRVGPTALPVLFLVLAVPLIALSMIRGFSVLWHKEPGKIGEIVKLMSLLLFLFFSMERELRARRSGAYLYWVCWLADRLFRL